MQGNAEVTIMRVAHSMGSSSLFNENVNPELDHKVKKVTEKLSENLHIIANEPSLAFFRIQEHVRKSLPQLVEKKHEVQEIQQNVQGSCFDTEYAINAVKSMHGTTVHFQNIQDLLKNAMFMKQQIQYEQARREQLKARPSMYRTMMRNNTVDIPASGRNSESSEGGGRDRPGAIPEEGSPRPRSSSLTSRAKPQDMTK